MSETPATDPPKPAAPGRCPSCGGQLSEPISGDVHCFAECRSCGERFELDAPELAGRSDPRR